MRATSLLENNSLEENSFKTGMRKKKVLLVDRHYNEYTPLYLPRKTSLEFARVDISILLSLNWKNSTFQSQNSNGLRYKKKKKNVQQYGLLEASTR